MSSGVDSRKPIVWIINKGGHNYTDAEKFGRVVPITTDSVNPFNLDRMMVLVKQRLIHANEADYLLISGSPILNAVVLAMWLERFGQAHILQWSIRKGRYERLFLSQEAVKSNANADIAVAD